MSPTVPAGRLSTGSGSRRAQPFLSPVLHHLRAHFLLSSRAHRLLLSTVVVHQVVRVLGLLLSGRAHRLLLLAHRLLLLSHRLLLLSGRAHHLLLLSSSYLGLSPPLGTTRLDSVWRMRPKEAFCMCRSSSSSSSHSTNIRNIIGLSRHTQHHAEAVA